MKKITFLLVFLMLGLSMALAAQPQPWEMTFQPAATPSMEKLTHLHHILLYMVFGVSAFVFLLLAVVMWRFREKANPTPSQNTGNAALEVVWTLVPLAIVVALMVPSLRLLYFMDKSVDAQMTVKVIGHQWYWSYEYPDEKMAFDSTMIEDKNLQSGQLRLLTVDNPLVVPAGVPIRILVTSTDVLHSWAVPSFGVKQDTVPGRLRETWIQVNEPGTYYGQCSELCGIKHGFMPIQVQAVPMEDYKAWINDNKQKFAAS